MYRKKLRLYLDLKMFIVLFMFYLQNIWIFSVSELFFVFLFLKYLFDIF